MNKDKVITLLERLTSLNEEKDRLLKELKREADSWKMPLEGACPRPAPPRQLSKPYPEGASWTRTDEAFAQTIAEGEQQIQENLAKYGQPYHPRMDFGRKGDYKEEWPAITFQRGPNVHKFYTVAHYVEVKHDYESGEYKLRLYAYMKEDSARYIKSAAARRWEVARLIAEQMLKEAKEENL